MCASSVACSCTPHYERSQVELSRPTQTRHQNVRDWPSSQLTTKFKPALSQQTRQALLPSSTSSTRAVERQSSQRGRSGNPWATESRCSNPWKAGCQEMRRNRNIVITQEGRDGHTPLSGQPKDAEIIGDGLCDRMMGIITSLRAIGLCGLAVTRCGVACKEPYDDGYADPARPLCSRIAHPAHHTTLPLTDTSTLSTSTDCAATAASQQYVSGCRFCRGQRTGTNLYSAIYHILGADFHVHAFDETSTCSLSAERRAKICATWQPATADAAKVDVPASFSLN